MGKPVVALWPCEKPLIDATKVGQILLWVLDGDSNIHTAVPLRGSVNWALSVTGRPAHSSGIFFLKKRLGIAIFEALARILNSEECN
jgi:hypothetical protein